MKHLQLKKSCIGVNCNYYENNYNSSSQFRPLLGRCNGVSHEWPCVWFNRNKLERNTGSLSSSLSAAKVQRIFYIAKYFEQNVQNYLCRWYFHGGNKGTMIFFGGATDAQVFRESMSLQDTKQAWWLSRVTMPSINLSL